MFSLDFYSSSLYAPYNFLQVYHCSVLFEISVYIYLRSLSRSLKLKIRIRFKAFDYKLYRPSALKYRVLISNTERTEFASSLSRSLASSSCIAIMTVLFVLLSTKLLRDQFESAPSKASMDIVVLQI